MQIDKPHGTDYRVPDFFGDGKSCADGLVVPVGYECPSSSDYPRPRGRGSVGVGAVKSPRGNERGQRQ